MSATYNLFKRWKDKRGFKSDRQAALALGISAQAVNVWKNGANGEPEFIEKMAHEIGEDPVKTILEAYAEQKKGASAKVLVKLSKRFYGLALVCLGFYSVSPAQAHTVTFGVDKSAHVIHYAKLLPSVVSPLDMPKTL